MENKQYIYVLKLIPELLEEKNWTERENNIVEEHFQVLKELEKEGKLILAGRTLNMDKDTFGIVIFKATSEKNASYIMENDPAVRGQIMTAKLYPYRVALINERNL